MWRRRFGRDFPADFPGGDFADFFAEFEKEFARMQGMIGKLMDDAMKHASGPHRHDPFVYGFTMRVGKDGQPHIQPFGNRSIPTTTTSDANVIEAHDARQPLTDVVESDDEIAVTVELPGVDKKDVNLHVAEDAISVKVETGRHYHAQIPLPAKVVPSTAKATFKNGILDVSVRRVEEPNMRGHRVDIE